MKYLKTVLILLSIAAVLSCRKEVGTDDAVDVTEKVQLTISATGEQATPEAKVTLDFSRTPNVRWSADDEIAVFDGTGI